MKSVCCAKDEESNKVFELEVKFNNVEDVKKSTAKAPLFTAEAFSSWILNTDPSRNTT